MMKPQPIDKPNRHTIETLFREAYATARTSSRTESDAAYQAMQELEDRLLNVPAMKAARRRHDAAYAAQCKREKGLFGMIDIARRDYLAKGLTPAVKKQIEAMLKALKKA